MLPVPCQLLFLRPCIRPWMRWAAAKLFADTARSRDMISSETPSLQTTICRWAYPLPLMKFLFPTVQKAIVETSWIFSGWIIWLRFVILYIPSMWIPTLWPVVPETTMNRPACGVICTICRVQPRTDFLLRFPAARLI